MILDLREADHLVWCIPRESGDDPEVFPMPPEEEEYSPRERG